MKGREWMHNEGVSECKLFQQEFDLGLPILFSVLITVTLFALNYTFMSFLIFFILSNPWSYSLFCFCHSISNYVKHCFLSIRPSGYPTFIHFFFFAIFSFFLSFFFPLFLTSIYSSFLPSFRYSFILFIQLPFISSFLPSNHLSIIHSFLLPFNQSVCFSFFLSFDSSIDCSFLYSFLQPDSS